MGKSTTTGSKHKGNGQGRTKKTKRKTRDFDQIYQDLQPANILKAMGQMTQVDEEKPGTSNDLNTDK